MTCSIIKDSISRPEYRMATIKGTVKKITSSVLSIKMGSTADKSSLKRLVPHLVESIVARVAGLERSAEETQNRAIFV